MTLPKGVHAQLERAYQLMAGADYRPAAPSDGLGNIVCPVAELDIDAEIREYAADWWKQEDDCKYVIGCANWTERVPMVLLIEAARACCRGEGGRDLALDLARLAIRELEAGE
jgi:hypothetical protein